MNDVVKWLLVGLGVLCIISPLITYGIAWAFYRGKHDAINQSIRNCPVCEDEGEDYIERETELPE